MVGGKMLAPIDIVTRRPTFADVAIENATRIEIGVDGEPSRRVTTEEAARIISGRPRQMLKVHLVNERTRDATATAVDYRLRVDVADPSELDRVDRAFIRHLARDDLRSADVVRFSDETDGLANYYRDGLASYVLGVLKKDTTVRPDDPNVLEHALDAFGLSASRLAGFCDRRVPRAVAACACLSLNDFSSARAPAGVPSVDVAMLFLHSLSTGNAPSPRPPEPDEQPSEVRCPVDQATFGFLELMFGLGKTNRSDMVTDAIERVEHGTLTPADRAKFAVVLGEWADEARRMDIVRRCAPILYNDPVFGAAANRWRVT
jgi:hypothetical protein